MTLKRWFIAGAILICGFGAFYFSKDYLSDETRLLFVVPIMLIPLVLFSAIRKVVHIHAELGPIFGFEEQDREEIFYDWGTEARMRVFKENGKVRSSKERIIFAIDGAHCWESAGNSQDASIAETQAYAAVFQTR